MRILPYRLGTMFSQREAKQIQDQNECPKCEDELVMETSGPLTDCYLCEKCNLAFTTEEVELSL